LAILPADAAAYLNGFLPRGYQLVTSWASYRNGCHQLTLPHPYRVMPFLAGSMRHLTNILRHDKLYSDSEIPECSHFKRNFRMGLDKDDEVCYANLDKLEWRFTKMRKVRITWKQLEEILKKQELVMDHENVSGVTLVRRRTLLLHLARLKSSQESPVVIKANNQ